MSSIVKAFETFTCDRCNRKETQMRDFIDRRLMSGPYLTGWGRISGKDFCPDCTKIVQDAMGGRP